MSASGLSFLDNEMVAPGPESDFFSESGSEMSGRYSHSNSRISAYVGDLLSVFTLQKQNFYKAVQGERENISQGQ